MLPDNQRMAPCPSQQEDVRRVAGRLGSSISATWRFSVPSRRIRLGGLLLTLTWVQTGITGHPIYRGYSVSNGSLAPLLEDIETSSEDRVELISLLVSKVCAERAVPTITGVLVSADRLALDLPEVAHD
jgi:hypothetical protein